MNVKVTTVNRLQRSEVITEYLDKGWMKKSIHRLLVKLGTVDRRVGSGRRSVRLRTDENVNTVESLLLSHEDKPQSETPNSQRNFTCCGGSIDHQFRGLFTKICFSSASRKGALNS